MLDLLRDFLDVNTTLEEKSCIKYVDGVLQSAQLEYEHVVEEILATSEEMDSGQAMTELHNLYHRNLDYLLDLHAIKLAHDVTLKQKGQIVEGLLAIDNHEDTDHFYRIANEEGPAIERLAVMLSNVITINADQLMHLIEDVSNIFFTRLKSANRAELEEDDVELHETRERIHAFRKLDIYLSSVGATITFMPDILRRVARPGMTYETYAKLIDGLQPIQTLPGIQIARELFAAALVSSDGFANPAETVKASLEQFIPDLKVVSAVMIEIRQLIMGYSK